MAYRRPEFPASDFWPPRPSRRLSPRQRQEGEVLSRREILYASQKGHCYWCQQYIPKGSETLEHLIPRSNKTHPLRSHPENFVVACVDCNSRRGCMDLFAWAKSCRVPVPSGLLSLLREQDR